MPPALIVQRPHFRREFHSRSSYGAVRCVADDGIKRLRLANRTLAVDGATVTVIWGGAADYQVPQLRSPGMTRDEKQTLDTNKRPYEPGGSVREVSCSFPLQRELHAMRQRGAFRDLRSLSEMF